MWADHMLSETYTDVTANGRTVQEWVNPPNGQNHFFDTLVGCHVAAVIEGVRHESSGMEGRKRRRILKTGDIQIG